MERKLQKNIFKLALPIFIELLCFTLLGTIDTLMLNSYSDSAVSSIANANTIINLFSVMLTVVATGVVVILTKTLGAKNKNDEGKIVGTGLLFNFLLGLIIALLLFVTGGLLLKILNTNPPVIGDASTYLRIISFGILFVSISHATGAIFRSYGKPFVVMTIAIISNVLNVFINYCLIFGNFGCPELGVMGAAIGTMFSNIFASIIALICLNKILGYSIFKLKICTTQLKNIFKIGGPAAAEHFLYNLSQFMIMIAVNSVLIDGITDHSASTRAYISVVLNFVMLFSISIANGNQIIVGYYVGENKFEEAKKFTFKSFRYSVYIVSVVVIFLNIFWRQIMGLLISNEVVLESINGVFIVVIFLELGRICNIVFIAALRAIGDIIFPVIMGVISMFGVAVLFSFIFTFGFKLGIIGIFIAQALDECFRGVFMLFRWKNTQSVTNKLLINQDMT